jgi:ERCC4-type nuclease
MLIIEDWHPWVGEEDDKESIKEKVRLHEKTLRTLNRRITVAETPHLSATVDLIEDIVRDMKNGKLFVMRRPIAVEEDMTDSMKVICSLPNVKRILGERILDKYGTVGKALADVDNWTEIDGIGEVKLARIRNTLEDEVYEQERD